MILRDRAASCNIWILKTGRSRATGMEKSTARTSSDQGKNDTEMSCENKTDVPAATSASSTNIDTPGEEAEVADIISKPQVKKKPKKKSIQTCKKHCAKVGSSKPVRKPSRVEESTSNSSSEESENHDVSTDSSSEESSSSEERRKRKAKKEKRKKKEALKRKMKAKKKHRKARKYDSSSDSESEESADECSSSESDDSTRARRKNRSKKRQSYAAESSDLEEEEAVVTETDQRLQQYQALQTLLRAQNLNSAPDIAAANAGLSQILKEQKRNRRNAVKEKKKKKASTLEFKRVDQLWDNTTHNYKLQESAEDRADEFDEYIFTVRRKFDWENKYRNTVIDIKSKLLRDVLAEVMKEVKSVSLVEEQPSLDPNMLFLYAEELKVHRKKILKTLLKREKKRKAKKRIQLQIAHCKLLEAYLDEDYEETKKTLYPMLEAGNITFDLLWALFKPNTIAYTATYGSVEDPRCFKVDYATKESSFMRGEWYSIDGRYMEYDGKCFGLGELGVDIDPFKGPRRITSLATYPLKYHKDPESIKNQLIERGQKFVALQGMNYRFHRGLAFHKKKKTVAKVNINGRVMIDPAIFRRINPNYMFSLIKQKGNDGEENADSDDNNDNCTECGGNSSDDDDKPPGQAEGPLSEEQSERVRYKVFIDRDKKVHIVAVPLDKDGREVIPEKIEALDTDENKQYIFSEEELLIASPVVFGFAFSEKLWLEFSLSGIQEIEWNEGAFSSLVLPADKKSIVKGMVSSHKFHAAETIDDVVQGKGRGLVFVLHGPPGVGKTLTAEGIAEYLKCPLYAVSAGELGTDSRVLEHELQKIMDIAHSWGAVLLLDEADVFLERRETHDIHRNALVSIFLRLLEYFQGILFLTTNRVETFDDAFQSRIHMPLRYGELSKKAKMEIWKTFVMKVTEMMEKDGGKGVGAFGEKEYEALARNNLNGRQIKNAVRTAQSLALSEDEMFSMQHIRRVLEVGEDFNNDLKGGTGYLDAMRSYT